MNGVGSQVFGIRVSNQTVNEKRFSALGWVPAVAASDMTGTRIALFYQ